jgi:hypothetical protein
VILQVLPIYSISCYIGQQGEKRRTKTNQTTNRCQHSSSSGCYQQPNVSLRSLLRLARFRADNRPALAPAEWPTRSGCHGASAGSSTKSRALNLTNAPTRARPAIAKSCSSPCCRPSSTGRVRCGPWNRSRVSRGRHGIAQNTPALSRYRPASTFEHPNQGHRAVGAPSDEADAVDQPSHHRLSPPRRKPRARAQHDGCWNTLAGLGCPDLATIREKAP